MKTAYHAHCKPVTRILFASCIVWLSAVAVSASAEETQAFYLSTRGSKLAHVLRDLGAHQGVPVIVSQKIDDSFIGSLNGVSPEQAFDRLAMLHHLAWYFDGQTIHVYKADEFGSRLVTPTYLKIQSLIQQLDVVGVLDKRYCQVREVSGSNAMEIHGLPVCLERVEKLATELDTQKLNHEQNQEEVRSFPLRYATAADVNYTYRGQEVVVPGVATLLKEMMQGRALPLKESHGQSQSSDRASPMLSVDARRNAVIVRDRKINFPIYDDLIAQLDYKPELVSVSVTIIDINSQDLSALGVDWSASARVGGGSVKLNSGTGLAGGNFSSMISDTDNFMLSLSALEQNSKAHMISRPSVVTLNNTQAVLDRNVTFYTKVSSENDARLESISTGSLLRVTPRVVRSDDGSTDIMLSLVIQDGRQTTPLSSQEPLPQTLNSEIVTQTLLKMGQGLLLGGLIQDEQVVGVRKIPWLGDIPLLGRLFRSTQENTRQTLRLFLITAEPLPSI
ncbi:EscC/YscC/HrcC family type III secretion system outer membrane ring protein [Pseudomonas sp. IPO3774]|uniref:EscC/YscC/HrcC family type III secretion system outer membrane ring protein n=1 Tax=Pseudomonas sp. IPO3774 TaxID=2738826 RepID=UPI00159FCF11|nr:EscC/YscC/HrcC family type III secretion system outer membrane ring protein [Pseudomonas sp. IPO3774]NWD64126.1 EscC/YscC/HrcC family type III secretion system outer membrane ring protein [Pseudomonas sp. IPO3774]